MRRLVHFEIHASDPERMLAFYTTLFGWKVQKLGGDLEYWLLTTGTPDEPGIDGALLRRRGAPPADGQPVNAFVCTVNVSSVDAIADQLPALGGSIALPKMAVPGVGWLMYLKDPDGNILGVLQNDAAAR
jgi:hypothetical protein